MEHFMLLISTFPDRASAEGFARTLVEARLAACVNLLAPCASVYRWNENVETAEEIPVLIKTRANLYPEVERELRRLHPYEVPELLSLPVQAGLPAYLQWLEAQTREADA